MEIVKIYSKIEDKQIQKNINNSPIWKEANHADELDGTTDHFEYTIKFDGLTPIQVTNIRKCKK